MLTSSAVTRNNERDTCWSVFMYSMYLWYNWCWRASIEGGSGGCGSCGETRKDDRTR